MFKATVKVTLKKTVLDPQGKTVGHALKSLGFSSVEDVRMGKLVELTLDSGDESQIKEMCEKLLTNPIIEEYAYTIEEV